MKVSRQNLKKGFAAELIVRGDLDAQRSAALADTGIEKTALQSMAGAADGLAPHLSGLYQDYSALIACVQKGSEGIAAPKSQRAHELMQAAARVPFAIDEKEFSALLSDGGYLSSLDDAVWQPHPKGARLSAFGDPANGTEDKLSYVNDGTDSSVNNKQEAKSGSGYVNSATTAPRGQSTERHLSEEGLKYIKQFEGLRETLYDCPGGSWTIGYGHVVLKGENFAKGITPEQATELLRKDVKKAEQAVLKLISVPLSDGQFDALVSFVFNVGAGALQDSTLRKELNRGNYAAVPAELRRWVRAGQKKLPGLVNRREAEISMFTSKSKPPEHETLRKDREVHVKSPKVEPGGGHVNNATTAHRGQSTENRGQAIAKGAEKSPKAERPTVSSSGDVYFKGTTMTKAGARQAPAGTKSVSLNVVATTQQYGECWAEVAKIVKSYTKLPALTADGAHYIGRAENQYGQIGCYKKDCELALTYIDDCLDNGLPVAVGTSYTDYHRNHDRITDHFIVVCGRGIDEAGRLYYEYVDPANQETKGQRLYVDDKTGVLFKEGKIWDKREKMSTTKTAFQVSQVRVYPADVHKGIKSFKDVTGSKATHHTVPPPPNA